MWRAATAAETGSSRSPGSWSSAACRTCWLSLATTRPRASPASRDRCSMSTRSACSRFIGTWSTRARADAAEPGQPGFYLGCAVSPFKRLEAEVVPQYLKLALKVRAGAEFVIPQLGYDARAWDELLRAMRRAQLRVPVLANVFVLSRTVARLFNANRVPGCVVSDELLARRRARSSRAGQRPRLLPRSRRAPGGGRAGPRFSRRVPGRPPARCRRGAGAGHGQPVTRPTTGAPSRARSATRPPGASACSRAIPRPAWRATSWTPPTPGP